MANFIWKTDEGEVESSIIVLIFVFWRWLIFDGGGIVGLCKNSFLGKAWVASFSSYVYK